MISLIYEIRKQELYGFLFKQTQYLTAINRYHFSVKEQEKLFQANKTKEDKDVEILISDKKDLKPKLTKRGKGGQQKYFIILNIYTLNIETLLVKNNTSIMGDFSTQLSPIDYLGK